MFNENCINVPLFSSFTGNLFEWRLNSDGIEEEKNSIRYEKEKEATLSELRVN